MNRDDRSNCRPVCHLSLLLQAMELCIRDAASTQVIRNVLLSQNQHGFVKGKWRRQIHYSWTMWPPAWKVDTAKVYCLVNYKFQLSELGATTVAPFVTRWIEDHLFGRGLNSRVDGAWFPLTSASSGWLKVCRSCLCCPQGLSTIQRWQSNFLVIHLPMTQKLRVATGRFWYRRISIPYGLGHQGGGAVFKSKIASIWPSAENQLRMPQPS